MLSALFMILFGMGAWYLTAYFKKKKLQKRFSDSSRFDINETLYGYVNDTHFILIASALQEEILRFGRNKIQRIEFGSESDKIERKSDEVVVLEWQEENGKSKLFKLDLFEPASKSKATTLCNFIKTNAVGDVNKF